MVTVAGFEGSSTHARAGAAKAISRSLSFRQSISRSRKVSCSEHDTARLLSLVKKRAQQMGPSASFRRGVLSVDLATQVVDEAPAFFLYSVDFTTLAPFEQLTR